MKRMFKILITLGFSVPLIAGCDSHEHTFSRSWDKDSNYHWHEATCGHDVASDKDVHNFRDLVIPATYESGGYTTHTCTVCGYSYKDNETGKLVHKYTITWKNYDGTILEIDDDVEEGALPTYDGATPTKPVDGTCTYSFAGWTPEVTVASMDQTYTATYSSNILSFFTVTFDSNGGSSVENQVVEKGEKVKKPDDPIRLGYTFLGWYDLSTDEKWSFSGFAVTQDVTLTAKWEIVTYFIQYNLDGGYLAKGDNNPTSYTVEDAITLSAPLKAGYAFQGWRLDDGSLITSINKGTVGNLILTAVWFANKNNLSVTSEDTSKGTVSIDSGVGYSNESITVTATPINDCVFKGWYNGTTKVSDDATYTFTMPTNDYSLVARFFTKAEEEERKKNLGIIPVFDEENKTVTYGLYPQTHVSDADTITVLNALTSAENNGWYLYNDEYYAKKTTDPIDSESEYSSGYTFDDDTKIKSGTSYWFKCDPIEWKILTSSDGTYSLVSTVLLDAHRYDDSSSNYKYSEIREWLNDDFLKTAFNLDSSLIQTTIVDNSASTTGNSSNPYACADTEDKVYLLSVEDYVNADYGFLTSEDSTTTRTCKPTDYALANSCYKNNGNGLYWTRSPLSYHRHSNYCYDAVIVHDEGNLDAYCVNRIWCGVRPALTISIQ